MGYGIYINDPATGEVIEIDEPHNIIGSTYRVGGDTRLQLQITTNYSPFYYRAETLGESTKIYGEKPVDGCLPVLHEEYGGIPGLQYLTIQQARERVLRAINALRDEPLDEHGKPYELTEWDVFHGHSVNNYWVPTERNARNALKNLLSLLLLAPDNAKIEVS
jgi:hypothetical protein